MTEPTILLFAEELDDVKYRVASVNQKRHLSTEGLTTPEDIVRDDVPRLIATIEHLWQVVAEYKEDQERRG